MFGSGFDKDILSFQVRMDNVVAVHQVQCFSDFNDKILELIKVVLNLINQRFIEHLL